MKIFRLIAFVGLSLVLAGCSTTVTNLTPSRQERVASGLYPFEVVFDSNQQSMRKETIKPSVIVGSESFPMKRAPMLKNRWETLVPVPAGKGVVNYRYKFDFDYNSVPQRRSSSVLSSPYQLRIVDRLSDGN